MSGVNHLLVIPDGSRRHAKREHLSQQFRAESEESFRHRLVGLDRGDATTLARRIANFSMTGEDPMDWDRRDELDAVEIDVPAEHLKSSYQASGLVVDSMLRWVLARGSIRILTLYGMQAANLCRSSDEVIAFLDVESSYAETWSRDPEIRSRCRFTMVGDRSLLTSKRGNPEFQTAVARYVEGTDQLVRSCDGSDLQINILAPYEATWEINQAVVNGHFDPAKLLVQDGVDLVFRSGSQGRSATSGAVPCQTAFSRLVRSLKYFPDCTVEELSRAIDEGAAQRLRSGL